MENKNIAIISLVVLVISGLFVYKLKTKKTDSKKAVSFIADEGRYKEDTWFVENYIQKKDWEMLESMLNSSTRDFPDLIEKIETALKNRSET